MHPATNSDQGEKKARFSNFYVLSAYSAAYLFFSLRAHSSKARNYLVFLLQYLYKVFVKVGSNHGF